MKVDRRESEGRNDAEMLLQMLSPPDHVILRYTEASLRLCSIRFPIHLWSWWCWTEIVWMCVLGGVGV